MGGGFADWLLPDGKFRVALSEEERQQFIEAVAGLVEIHCLANNQRHEVYFGELSKDPTHPTVFITEIAPPAKSK